MSNETSNVSLQGRTEEMLNNGMKGKDGYDLLPESEVTKEGYDNALNESFSDFKLLTQHELQLNLIMGAIRRSQKWAVYLGAGGFSIVVSILFAMIELSFTQSNEVMAHFGTNQFHIYLGLIFGLGVILILLGIARTLNRNDGIYTVMKYDDSVMLVINIAKAIRLCECEEPQMPSIEHKLSIVQLFKNIDISDFRAIYKSIYTRNQGDILTHEEADSIYHIINIVMPIIMVRADECYKKAIQNKLISRKQGI